MPQQRRTEPTFEPLGDRLDAARRPIEADDAGVEGAASEAASAGRWIPGGREFGLVLMLATVGVIAWAMHAAGLGAEAEAAGAAEAKAAERQRAEREQFSYTVEGILEASKR
jgi:hypothetical protein